nr:reverse transcriptase domain-containing protein [Tanacetum cinerariifolium]
SHVFCIICDYLHFCLTDSEPGRVFWGADKELSDGGSPRVIVYGYDGLLMQPVAPPSPHYIPGPEEPQTPPVPQDEDEREPMFIQPHDPGYVPELMYPEYIPLEEEHVLPVEEQPLPPVDAPTAESPRYVAESDPEEDPEEYKDDETEDGPVNYPMDGGDDGDDDDDDSSRDDTDDEDEDEEDEEEEEHLASAESAVVVPTVEPVSPPEGTKLVIPPPSTDITTTKARITVQLQASIPLPPEAEAERLLAMPTPPPSPLTSLSPPSAGERLARMASTQALIDAVTTALPSPPLPPLPPPLYIPPPVDRRDDIPKTEMPPHKRSCLFTLGSRYEIGESFTARTIEGRMIDYRFVSTLDAKTRRRGIGEVGYGIRDTWVDPAEAVHEIAPMTLGEVNTRVKELAELHEHDTQDLYALLEDAKDSICIRVSAPCTSNTATVAGYSSSDIIPDGRDSLSDMRHKTRDGDMHAELLALQEHSRKARQPGSDARVPNHQDAPRDTDNKIFRLDAYSMTWEVFKKKMTDKYCPRGEIKKLEIELWNLKFVANETEKIDKYISGLPNNIYGSVKSSKAKMLDETIELANDFMDQKLRTYEERQTNNKRKADDLSRKNHGHQQQPAKRQNVAKVYNMGSGEKKPYGGNCPSAPSAIFITMARRDNREIPKGNGCFECGALGHFKRDCLKLKNKDEGYIFAKKEEDKSEGKQLEEVPIVRDFPEVFPKDLPGLPPARPVELQIDLILGDKKEHIKHLKEILELLKEDKLYTKFSKCEFWIPKGEKEENAFQLLKQKLCSAPILALPEGSKDFVVYCDASHKGLGAMLMQREKRHYLCGTKCTVFTDHKSLQHILDQKDLNIRQHRWLELMSDYDCDIRYHPGKANVVADALSHKERMEALRVRALVMTIGLDLPKKILKARVEALKLENLENEDVDAQLAGPETIQERMEKIVLIKQRIQTAQDQQKSYADLKRKPMEFKVGDRVMLKVSHWKEVVRFGKRGKLNPRYVGPFKVLAKVEKVAYRLELPQELSRVHHTFHGSNIKKCYADEPLVMPLAGIHIDDKLQFVEEPVEIIEREITRLKRC